MNTLAASSRVSVVRRTDGRVRREVISTRAQLETLLPEWDELLKSALPHTIFQTPGWTRSLLGREPGPLLRMPAVYDGDRLIGILPAMLDGSRLRMLGYPYSDYNDVICADQDTPVVLEHSLRALFSLGDWEECEFDHIPAQGRLARHLASVPSFLRRNAQVVYRAACPAMVAPGNGDPLLTPAKARGFKKRRTRLERAGHFVFRHLETREEVSEMIPILLRQHAARMEARQQSSKLLEDRAREILSACAQHMDPRRELRFSVLELDGKPLACHLGFELGGTFYYYVAGFDPAFAAHSPGDVLLGALLEYASKRGIEEFDFGIGGETYKRRFANCIRDNLTLFVPRLGRSLPARIRRSTIGWLRRYMENAERRAFEEHTPPGPALRLLHAGLRARARLSASLPPRRAA